MLTKAHLRSFYSCRHSRRFISITFANLFSSLHVWLPNNILYYKLNSFTCFYVHASMVRYVSITYVNHIVYGRFVKYIYYFSLRILVTNLSLLQQYALQNIHSIHIRWILKCIIMIHRPMSYKLFS